ncbi:MAG: alanine--tRNA ligase [Pseudomonadota bacterium]|nr:alanine--tRNA ligase [Pseudomonadota bacterium]
MSITEKLHSGTTSKEIRETFLSYFESCGYQRHDSASLVPAGDQTLLFTNAGMVPFKDYFLGDETPPSLRMTTSQKCVRAGGKHNDLDQVGLTARHHTFFEMLGNFVFKGASKSQAIKEAWVLITQHYKIPPEKLYVTVFNDDDESRAIWENEIGLSTDRVISCGEADNFWSMGDTGPCGPCTEIFYDHGDHIQGGLPGTEDADGDRYTEIWNLVFMQYQMHADGSRTDLDSMGLDTGMGLERLTAVMQSVHNNFESDLFTPIIEAIQKHTTGIDLVASRVIADHIRSSVFLIVDQVYPSNEGRGYVLRRIIRRAMAFAYRCGVSEPFFHQLTTAVCNIMGDAYPEIIDQESVITQVIKDEEQRFQTTIDQGLKILQKNIDEKIDIDGALAFKMYDTYGFPIDIAQDIARKYQLSLDEDGFNKHMALQKERSRASQSFKAVSDGIKYDTPTDFIGHTDEEGEGNILFIEMDNQHVTSLNQGDTGIIVVDRSPFYAEGGGQVGDIGKIVSPNGEFTVTDTQKSGKTILHIGQVASGAFEVGEAVQLAVDIKRRDTTCNHSATHLIHAALRSVIGKHVVQKGSLVNHERLRFDFTHNSPLSDQELIDIEKTVNDQIRRNYPQICDWVSLADARKMDIMALFEEKYEDPVRVVRFGEFSAELCGGTHVQATGEIGLFKLLSETGIASGVRRIEAITGAAAVQWVQDQNKTLVGIASSLKCDKEVVGKKVSQLKSEMKELRKLQEQNQKKIYEQKVQSWIDAAPPLGNGSLVIQVLENISPKLLKVIHDLIKSSLESGVIVLILNTQSQSTVLVGAKNADHKANELLNQITQKHQGKGGGSPVMAQGVLPTTITVDEVTSLLTE